MIYPDLSKWPPIGPGVRARLGIPAIIHRMLEPIRVARGIKAHDNRFEPDDAGTSWLVFPQFKDVLFWNPHSAAVVSWNGLAFAFGEEQIEEAATCALDFRLNIFADPLQWLHASCDGISITNWRHAFDRLRDVPRVAVDEAILKQYERSMKPQRLPRVFVIPAAARKAA